jgi:hypothetical protein
MAWGSSKKEDVARLEATVAAMRARRPQEPTSEVLGVVRLSDPQPELPQLDGSTTSTPTSTMSGSSGGSVIVGDIGPAAS